MARRPSRYTVYDMMEEKGIFDRNPANVYAVDADGASLYTGPVEFPKMLYHPEGAERVTVPAEPTMTPFGPRMLGEQRELVSQVVHTAEAEAELLAKGWHRNPQRALAAAGKVTLAETPDEKIARMEAEIARLQADQADAKAEAIAGAKAVGQIVSTKAKAQSLLNPTLD